MTARRAHLVERAVEAMGGLGAITPAARLPPFRAPDPPAPPAGGAGADAAPPASPRATAIPLPTSAEPVAPPIGLNVLARAGLILTPSTGRSRVSEEIGVTQQQVLRAVQAADAAEARSRVVLITSAHPGEGKTFTALNLAAAIAAGGSHPVVLVDADGKKGSLSETLGMADSTGLRTLATDSRRHPRSMLMPTAVPRMWLLPYGAPVPGKPEVPPGTAVAAALRRVAEAMPGHLVLLDSPPCLSTSDPSTLATIAGQVILVVEAERTQRSEVEASLDLVEACPVLQLLLNKARLTDSDTFGAYVGAYAGH